jgi:hypothetical protein
MLEFMVCSRWDVEGLFMLEFMVCSRWDVEDLFMLEFMVCSRWDVEDLFMLEFMVCSSRQRSKNLGKKVLRPFLGYKVSVWESFFAMAEIPRNEATESTDQARAFRF